MGSIHYPNTSNDVGNDGNNGPPRLGAGPMPGATYGPGVLRVSAHGGGSAARNDYELSDYRQDGTTAATNIRHLPYEVREQNPHTIIANSCNTDPHGAGPEDWNIAATERPALSRVVMTPRGYAGVGLGAAGVGWRPGDYAGALSEADPYAAETYVHPDGDRAAAMHDYRLTAGGDASNSRHWTDTGVYTDARAETVPIISLHGEAKEIGRHLGLGPQLGGGSFSSYLDKVKSINANPDATYRQKVQANFARPVGSVSTAVRESLGFAGDALRRTLPTPDPAARRRLQALQKSLYGYQPPQVKSVPAVTPAF